MEPQELQLITWLSSASPDDCAAIYSLVVVAGLDIKANKPHSPGLVIESLG